MTVHGKSWMIYSAVHITIFMFSNSSLGLFSSEDCRKISFSPDGTYIAFLCEKKHYILIPPDSPLYLSREIHLYWCNVSNPDKKTSLKLDSIGKKYSGYVSLPMDLKFAPDSKHVGVFTPNYLSVVDLRTKIVNHLNQPGEQVTSFQWINNNELAYVVCEIKKDTMTKSFWQQKISEEYKKRIKIHVDAVQEEESDPSRPLSVFPLEDWSPKGRYVIYRNPELGGCLKILDIQKGTVYPLGKNRVFNFAWFRSGTTWRADESKVFCAGRIFREDKQWAYLIHLPEMKIVDCSKDYQNIFGKRTAEFHPIWTVDNRFILAQQYSSLGPCLIQPIPWKVIPLEEQIGKHLDPKQAPNYGFDVYPFPVKGWICIVVKNYKNALTHLNAPKYAIDYSFDKCIFLFDKTGEWSFSPKGDLAAVVDSDKKIRLIKIDL